MKSNNPYLVSASLYGALAFIVWAVFNNPGVISFALYFLVALAFWMAALFFYVKVTPYSEFALVREGNLAAAVSLSGTALGMALPLASLAIHAVSIADLAFWALIALMAQLALWFGLRKCVLPELEQAITTGKLAPAVVLGGFSIALGLLNAASLSY